MMVGWWVSVDEVWHAHRGEKQSTMRVIRQSNAATTTLQSNSM